MTEVRSPDQRGGSPRARMRVLGLAGLVVGGVLIYLAFGRDATSEMTKQLLPYQLLIRTLPENEQKMYTEIRQALATAEAERSQSKRWPDAGGLAARGVAPFTDAAVKWQQFHQGATVSYFGTPVDPSAPAWMLTIQEPEPNTPPDPAPNDDEHHRLSDGTTLHIYVWMHRYGGQVPARFVTQPQNEGWLELFATPPNPVVPRRSS